MFDHLCPTEIAAWLIGIVTFWTIVFNAEKDVFDDDDTIKWSLSYWVKDFFTKRYDNILAHVMVSFFFLFLGVENLEKWLGEWLEIPKTANEIGAAGMMGFMGSYIASFFKLAYQKFIMK